MACFSNYYNISFNNISYKKETEFFGRTIPSHYTANMKLVNQYEEITIDNLMLYDNSPWNGERMRIDYYVNFGDHYILIRYP